MIFEILIVCFILKLILKRIFYLLILISSLYYQLSIFPILQISLSKIIRTKSYEINENNN